MRNLHVIPTDKTSKLQLNVNTKKLILFDNIQSNNESVHLTTQHIYITSDEEIKEGDWCINLNSPYKHKELCRIDNQIELERYAKKIGNNCKKIILTTDQDLIKDGVQSIDDEFLEWFVKNPSCENVEVKPLLSNNGRALFGYKIIIPKEEPKQENCCTPIGQIKRYKDCIGCDRKPKQETVEEFIGYGYDPNAPGDPDKIDDLIEQKTLEEAAEKVSELGEYDRSFESTRKNYFIKGAKWQQERMSIHILDVDNVYAHIENGVVIIEKNDKGKISYSEDEVELMIKIFNSYWFENNHEHEDNLKEWELSKKLFEQFKKG